MGSLRDEEFRRWEVYEMGSLGDGEYRGLGVQDMGFTGWGVHELRILADWEFKN